MRPKTKSMLLAFALAGCSTSQGPVGGSTGADAQSSGGLTLGNTGGGVGTSSAAGSSTGTASSGSASSGGETGAASSGGSSAAASSTGAVTAGESSGSGGVSSTGGGSSAASSSSSGSGGGSSTGGSTGATSPCGDANFTVSCPFGSCPANSSCAGSGSCVCNGGTVALYCTGALCDNGCVFGNWWCAPLQPGACGAQNFDVPCASDAGAYDCPSNSHCAGGGCSCNGGFLAETCSGQTCTSQCGYPDWWCAGPDAG